MNKLENIINVELGKTLNNVGKTISKSIMSSTICCVYNCYADEYIIHIPIDRPDLLVYIKEVFNNHRLDIYNTSSACEEGWNSIFTNKL